MLRFAFKGYVERKVEHSVYGYNILYIDISYADISRIQEIS
jgi:hypothetical protein